MNRKVGIGAIKQQKREQEKYKGKTNEIQDVEMNRLFQQMEIFQQKLEEFAAKHKSEIKKNADFRREFQRMCSSLGVDPLVSSKGFWAVVGIGEFYYELAVQVVEVCLATSANNGGLISIDELRNRLISARGKGKKHQEISTEDIFCAIRKLKILNGGYQLVGTAFLQSVPAELNNDMYRVLEHMLQENEYSITVSVLSKRFDWNTHRVTHCLEQLLGTGFVWVDLAETEPSYWFPNLFPDCIAAE